MRLGKTAVEGAALACSSHDRPCAFGILGLIGEWKTKWNFVYFALGGCILSYKVLLLPNPLNNGVVDMHYMRI